jgi:Protein of unknown function (DUF3551)
MRTCLAIALAGVAVGTAALRPAQAQVARPWCEQSSAFTSAPDCSYWTFAQCIATARGDGTCLRNPRFDWPYYQRGQTPPVDTDYYGRPLGPPPPRRR